MTSRLAERATTSDALSALAAATVTVATFTKTFVPFYLVGSTPIFVAASLLGLALIAVRWREILHNGQYAREFGAAAAALYALIITNFLILSPREVPATHLAGILAFHGLFLVFGFAAARSLKTVFFMLLLQGAIYVAIIAHYAITHGDVMRNGELEDVFGIGVELLVLALHQHIGIALSLAFLALLGLESRWAKWLALAALPFVLLFMFHIAARGAIFALGCSLAFILWANLWLRSKRSALLILATIIALGVVASSLFYNFALRDRNIDTTAPDAVSRTIRELQSEKPTLRLPIWDRAWHHIVEEPVRIPLGHGIGSYSIEDGFGPPTWLLDKSPKHYPHNLYLEMLYETGIVGLLLTVILTMLPLSASLKLWAALSWQGRIAIAAYVFYLAGSQVSGTFSYDYPFQFFLALAIGTIALKRKVLAERAFGPSPDTPAKLT